MKFAIFGATGWVGGAVTQETLSRGHEVTAVVRDPSRIKLKHPKLRVVTGDATDPASVASVVAGHDAVIASIGGRTGGHHEVVPAAARALLVGLARGGVKRLVWVGGAGSLEVAPGVRLVDTPQFPVEWKAEALAQVEALGIFRSSTEDIDWTFVSPAALLEPGERTGRYRTGDDQLVTDEKGESRISVGDFALALLDEVEHPAHMRKRFTVAY